MNVGDAPRRARAHRAHRARDRASRDVLRARASGRRRGGLVVYHLDAAGRHEQCERAQRARRRADARLWRRCTPAAVGGVTITRASPLGHPRRRRLASRPPPCCARRGARVGARRVGATASRGPPAAQLDAWRERTILLLQLVPRLLQDAADTSALALPTEEEEKAAAAAAGAVAARRAVGRRDGRGARVDARGRRPRAPTRGARALRRCAYACSPRLTRPRPWAARSRHSSHTSRSTTRRWRLLAFALCGARCRRRRALRAAPPCRRAWAARRLAPRTARARDGAPAHATRRGGSRRCSTARARSARRRSRARAGASRLLLLLRFACSWSYPPTRRRARRALPPRCTTRSARCRRRRCAGTARLQVDTHRCGWRSSARSRAACASAPSLLARGTLVCAPTLGVASAREAAGHCSRRRGGRRTCAGRRQWRARKRPQWPSSEARHRVGAPRSPSRPRSATAGASVGARLFGIASDSTRARRRQQAPRQARCRAPRRPSPAAATPRSSSLDGERPPPRELSNREAALAVRRRRLGHRHRALAADAAGARVVFERLALEDRSSQPPPPAAPTSPLGDDLPPLIDLVARPSLDESSRALTLGSSATRSGSSATPDEARSRVVVTEAAAPAAGEASSSSKSRLIPRTSAIRPTRSITSAIS